ncbi:hypothetical protein OB955_22040 [Halobacteria archaeon AArc-m2/3/4]|uniref:Nucleotidyltransferase-like protein n=1 Tax=Natronoglomus mannanivorans TaxID=2979990 RepID=A0ABT2QKG1_9EURY|nr:hypothetical protein [Halobacteria archaeon AArc-m2/3/4]
MAQVMVSVHPQRCVLDVLDNDYEGTGLVDHNLRDRERILRYAEKNGVDYLYSQKLNDGDDTNSFEKDISNTKKLISLLNEVCGELDITYKVIKLYNEVPHIPNDLDIFVSSNDREVLIKTLTDRGLDLIEDNVAETKLRGEFGKVDIYTEINYGGIPFVNPDKILNHGADNDFFGVNYPGVTSNTDLLILIPHQVIGHKRITLLDLLHLKSLLEKADLEKCCEYAQDLGWEPLFYNTVELLTTLIDMIYNEGKVIEFPYMFSYDFVISSIEESSKQELSLKNRILFSSSYVLHYFMYKSEGTWLYNMLKSNSTTRWLVNNLSHSLNVLRGDKSSTNES